MTPLTEVVGNELIRERFGLLAEAAETVATPQIRNQGTLGGNLVQDTRCWYLPRRLAVLPGGRQHLLRRHAGVDETASTASSTRRAASRSPLRTPRRR